jgi:hypothetical protein
MNDRYQHCTSEAILIIGKPSGLLLWLALVFLAAPFAARALTLGQVDDFQDGTAQNWQTGIQLVGNIASGGPNGSGDRYIQYTSSGGGGVGSRMVIFNTSQWLGDYNSAGITGIEMDLDNFSSQPLSMRIAFFLNSFTGYVSTTPVPLAAGSGWQHVIFSLSAVNFTAIGSPGDFNTLLSNFNGQLRLLDSFAPSMQGDVIAATLGADNIQAIPEPTALALVGASLVALVCCGRLSPKSRFGRARHSITQLAP